MIKEELRSLIIAAVDDLLDHQSESLLLQFDQIVVSENILNEIVEGEKSKLSNFPKSTLRSDAFRDIEHLSIAFSGVKLKEKTALYLLGNLASASFEEVSAGSDEVITHVDSSTLERVSLMAHQGYSPDDIAKDQSLVVEDVIEFMNSSK